MSVTGVPPLVSVIVPAWQQDRHREAALRSVHDQDHEMIEIVVVDDGPEQRASSAIRGYLERDDVRSRFRRIVFVEQSVSIGRSGAINRGLEAAQGDYVNILEAEGAFARARFSRLLSACADHDARLAFSRVEADIDSALASSSASVEADFLYSMQDDIEIFPTVGYALLRSFCAVSTSNLLFRRELAESIGGFGPFEYLAGWDFALRCLLLSEPIFVPEPLYLHRVDGHEAGAPQRQLEAIEKETALKNYLFSCRNRQVGNLIAPSPSWGPFFDSFISESRYGGYLAKP
jgi:glycosyltransferase involved in cell wall biosynthesis